MAYTPINWQTGDTITADKLNRCDNGWGYESTQLFSETVTTEVDEYAPDDPAFASLTYSTQITADTLIVTFDGVDYTCPKNALGASTAYGGMSDSGPDFTDYPFAITSAPALFGGGFFNTLYTQTAGEHTISVVASTMQTSPAFEAAVNSVVDTSTMPMLCVSGTTTYAQMKVASDGGRMLYFKVSDTGTRLITGFTNDVSATAVRFIPDGGSAMTAGFDSNMVFTVYIS